MLIQLREGLRKSKVLKFVFIGIITVPFALFGVGSYFTAAYDTDAATVNGEEISVQQFQSALLQQQDRMRQMFGGQVPTGLMENPEMREGALEQLVQRQLMAQRVRDQNYTVSDAELVKAIREREEFQVNGVFDQGRYEQILTANRMSNSVFEESTRNEQGLVQLYNAITSTAFVLPQEANLSSGLRNQERELLIAEFDVSELSEASEVSDEELTQHYENNEASYMRPEQFKVSYVELDIDVLGGQADVDEAEIVEEYQARIDEFATPEQRDASHILLTLAEDAGQSEVDQVLAKAADLKQKLDAGADFGALASEFSNDPGSAENGGSLGLFGKGAMVEAFETAAFALAVDEISEPVRSPFGVHIIKLNAIEVSSESTGIDDVRDQLKAELVERKVAAVFFEKQDVLATESFENGGSLGPAADALGVDVQQSEWFSSEEAVGVGRFAQVREAVLTDDVLNAGLNSAVLEVGDNHAVVIRLDERKPEELKPLDEVREQILVELKNEKGNALAQEKAEALLAALKSGEDLAQAAIAQGVEFAEPVWSKRNNPEIDRLVLAAVFALPHVKDGQTEWGQVSSSIGNPAVLGLSGVRADESEDSSNTDSGITGQSQQQGNAVFQALQAGMREVADVVVNTNAINPAAEESTYQGSAYGGGSGYGQM